MHLALRDLHPAKPQYSDDPQVHGQHHKGHRRRTQARYDEGLVYQSVIGAAEALFFMRAAHKGFYHAHAGKILLNHAVEGIELLLYPCVEWGCLVDEP
ncbi:MAG: hypothetical protein BWY63_01587 [Chloroflexi bacterium ADurb.Bin360]|nr:MAG: hypothetical protein BWY63_01587 [Chloroflexi bacterium ADurb.Bin360]